MDVWKQQDMDVEVAAIQPIICCDCMSGYGRLIVALTATPIMSPLKQRTKPLPR